MSGYLLIFCAEWRRHRVNLRFLLFAGAELKIPRVMRSYYGAIFGFLPLALFEAKLNWSWETEALQVFGLLLISSGLTLRLWTLATLGPAWTMSCLYWPQMPRIQRGPYKFVKHPEYLSRIMDCAGLCLAVNAVWTAAAAALTLTVFSLAIIRIENRDLGYLRDEVIEPEALSDTGFAP